MAGLGMSAPSLRLKTLRSKWIRIPVPVLLLLTYLQSVGSRPISQLPIFWDISYYPRPVSYKQDPSTKSDQPR
jgi:hypothetical protein